MKRPLITEHNCETGNVITREMTDEELLQYEKDVARIQELEKAETEKENVKQSAFKKLAALGLTEEEIAAL